MKIPDKETKTCMLKMLYKLKKLKENMTMMREKMEDTQNRPQENPR